MGFVKQKVESALNPKVEAYLRGFVALTVQQISVGAR
jgi:hypothetical protein